MKTVYEVEDIVRITTNLFKEWNGVITNIIYNNLHEPIYTIHIYASLNHSAFDIYALPDEIEYMGHCD